MKKMSYWFEPIALFALVLSVLGAINAPATASTNTTTNNPIQESESTSFQRQGSFELAQNLVGQCRTAKQRIFVYSQRLTSSRTLRTLDTNEQVTLADNGSSGWIGISSPVVGYVQANDLTTCTTATKPPSSGTGAGICRVVNRDLSIRQGPGQGSATIGGVAKEATVKLASPQQSQTNASENNRVWVKIVAPTSGWISSGVSAYPEGNLGPKFSCP
ncbi:MAG: SH3 domain-containing protein [Potamolinea sp.]